MTAPASRTRRVIGALLLAQLGAAAVLVWHDLGGALSRLAPGPAAPAMDQPVAPGDQTRRYRLPARPGTSPLPSRRDLPDRLTLTRDEDGTARLEGQIVAGDAERIAALLRAEPPGRLTLNSPGGSVFDALEVGRAVRELELAVTVAAGDVCLSACPYLLAGGATRTVEDGAYVGVHQHYFGQSAVIPAFLAVEDVQRGQAEVMDHLDAMGVDPLLMRHAMATPPGEIYLLVPEELAAYRLVTGPENAPAE